MSRRVSRCCCCLVACSTLIWVGMLRAGSDEHPEQVPGLTLEEAVERVQRVAELNRRVETLFEQKRFREAREVLRELNRIDPLDKYTLYNLACAYAVLDDSETAMEYLLDALSCGFVEFHHMVQDPNLELLRGHPRYLAIIENWSLLLDRRSEAEFAAMKAFFGPRYTYERDQDLRLNFVNSFDEDSFVAAQGEIQRVAEWAGALFSDPAPSSDRPDPWVHILLPNYEDFFRLVPSARIGGMYDRKRTRLITRDIGPSLRHEFMHVLHWRHMDRLGQVHPIWIQEGLATLVEDIDAPADGSGGMEIRLSWRTNIASRLVRGGAVIPFERFTGMDREQFMGRRVSAHYAQARTMMLYLHEKGLLESWYRAYVEGFDEDPTGLEALIVTLDAPLRDIERAYRVWSLNLPRVAEIDRPGEASLGVELKPGRGIGPEVNLINDQLARTVRPWGRGDRLRNRDIIIEVGGTQVRTLDDLYRVLGEYEPEDIVPVRVRRGEREYELNIELIERPKQEIF